MLRPFGKNKPSKGTENDVESPVINRGNKQLALAGKAVNSPSQRALKLKSNNQKESRFNNNDNQKPQKLSSEHLNIPQKRSNVSAQQKQQVKRPHTQSVEVTHRRREQEIEWAPVGLDLDFSAFDDTVDESSYHMHESKLENDLFEEEFPSIERHFNKELEEPVMEADIESDTEISMEQDLTRVEYAPPKEQEIPFKPDESAVVDLTIFNGIADIDAYELSRHFDKFSQLEFPVYEDKDVFYLQQYQDIHEDSLAFEYTAEDETDLSSSSDADFSSIPYYDYELDIDQFVKCN